MRLRLKTLARISGFAALCAAGYVVAAIASGTSLSAIVETGGGHPTTVQHGTTLGDPTTDHGATTHDGTTTDHGTTTTTAGGAAAGTTTAPFTPPTVGATQSGGTPKGGAVLGTSTQPRGNLPFTGLPADLLVVLGVALAATGFGRLRQFLTGTD